MWMCFMVGIDYQRKASSEITLMTKEWWFYRVLLQQLMADNPGIPKTGFFSQTDSQGWAHCSRESRYIQMHFEKLLNHFAIRALQRCVYYLCIYIHYTCILYIYTHTYNWYTFDSCLFGVEIYQRQFFQIRILTYYRYLHTYMHTYIDRYIDRYIDS